MGDLDEAQERITLALYGGALAAIGVLLVAFLFYLQTALPLIRDLSATLSAPLAEEVVATDEAGNTTTIPAVQSAPTQGEAATGADPATQLRLVVAATILGAALIGWALAASPWRGIGAMAAIHLAIIAASFPLADRLADPVWFLGGLLLVPALTITGALALRRTSPQARRFLPGALIALCTPLAFLFSVTLGWWIVPLAWVILPIVAAIASARGDTPLGEPAV